MGQVLLLIALRNVLRNRRRSLITFSAIFVALGVMTSIRGCLNGLQTTILDTVILGQTGALQVHRKGYSAAMLSSSLSMDIPADEAFLARITAIPGVIGAAARINFSGIANAHDITAFAQFTAIDPQNETRVCPRR